MKALTLIVLLCGALLFVGCNKSDNANTANANNSNTDAKPAATKAGETAAKGTTGGSIGVAACDEYLAKVAKCMDNPNIPDGVKTTYKQSMEQNRKAWEQAASTPQGKASLETSCKTVLDSSQAFFATCK